MAAVRVESTFHVPGVTSEQVWAYLEDVENSSDWNTFVQSAEALDPPGVGRRIRSHVGFLGITFPVEAVAEVSEPPHHSVVVGTKPFTSQIGTRLHDVEDGVQMTTWVEMSPGKFFPVPKFVLKKAVQSQYDRDMQLLRSKLEALGS